MERELFILQTFPDWNMMSTNVMLKTNTLCIVLGSMLVMTIMMMMMTMTKLPTAWADNTSLGVFLPGSKPYGMTYGEWSAKWWQWVFSIPLQNNPLNDPTGKNCGQAQNGPVWFLAGTSGGAAERSCVIPAGKAIMFPIFNFECSYLEFPALKTVSDLLSCAKEQLDHINSMDATIDGVSLQDLASYRTQSQLFNISLPPNNLLGPNPSSTQAAADGFWILLHPLTAGKHEIHFHGSGADFTSTSTMNLLVDVKYHLTVRS